MASQVTSTGTSKRRISCCISASARARRTPFPIRIIGRSARFSSCQDGNDFIIGVPTLAGPIGIKVCGKLLPDRIVEEAAGSSIGDACTSKGMSIHTGPGRPVRARSQIQPFRGDSGFRSGSSTVTAYLVMGLTMETMSTSWTPTWRIPERLIFVVKSTIRSLDLPGDE